MTPNAIPERSTSRHSGQYRQSVDPQRLLQIFTESHSIALKSKDPETARSRFELALEAYHQIMSLALAPDLRSTVQDAMSKLVDQFPMQVCLNQALGLCAKARKLKTRHRKLEYLHQARDILHAALGTSPQGATAMQATYDQVLADIALERG